MTTTCEHLHVTRFTTGCTLATMEDPSEEYGYVVCNDCGEKLDFEFDPTDDGGTLEESTDYGDYDPSYPGDDYDPDDDAFVMRGESIAEKFAFDTMMDALEYGME